MSLFTYLGRLRWAGLTEGLSFLLLLFFAMPMKYLAGRPEFVRVIGMVHGILFIIYVLALFQAAIAHGWNLKRIVVLFVASLLPFGTLAADYWILRELREEPEGD